MKREPTLIFSVFLFFNLINAQDYSLPKDSVIQIGNSSDLFSQNDSLNFAYGLSYGDSIRRCFFNNDTTHKSFYSFINAFDVVLGLEDWLNVDSGIDRESDHAKMYKKGVNVGGFITKKNSEGLMGDSTILFNEKLVETGFLNALNDSFFLMNPEEASGFITRKITNPKYNSRLDRDVIVIRMLNYAYGMDMGATLKEKYFKGDSAKLKLIPFIEGFKASMDINERKYFEIYDLGTVFGISLKNQIGLGLHNDSSVKVNVELVRQGLLDGLLGSTSLIAASQKPQENVKQTIQTVLQEKKVDNQTDLNRIAGENFLAENAKKVGVISTKSGLQYEILINGNGAIPFVSSIVKLNYQVTLMDGTVIESSTDYKGSIVLPINQLFKGLAEALQLISVGSKFKIFVPQELAYGINSQGLIKPFSMLILEVELLSIEG